MAFDAESHRVLLYEAGLQGSAVDGDCAGRPLRRKNDAKCILSPEYFFLLAVVSSLDSIFSLRLLDCLLYCFLARRPDRSRMREKETTAGVT